MRHWNRGRKTVRNFLLALVLALLVYASQGFPPYTVRGMCLRIGHDYLLEEPEPLYVQRDWRHYAANRYARYTMVAARSGETYGFFRYEDGLLGSQRDRSWFQPVFGEGAVCVARGGKIYAAGAFENAVSATAVVRVEKGPEPDGTAMSRAFTLTGERLAEDVFAFPYQAERSQAYWEAWEGGDYDDRDLNLEELVELWYREPAEDAGPGVYRMLDEELPCTVTLYDGAGEVLKTVSLTVTTDGIRSWW